jgi:hypothetical protein
LRIWIALDGRLPFPVDRRAEAGAVAAGEEVLVTRTRRGHTERLVELRLGRILPTHAGRLGRGDSGLGQTEIAVGIFRAEAAQGLHQVEAVKNGVAVIAELLELVAGASGQAAAVGEEIA